MVEGSWRRECRKSSRFDCWPLYYYEIDVEVEGCCTVLAVIYA